MRKTRALGAVCGALALVTAACGSASAPVGAQDGDIAGDAQAETTTLVVAMGHENPYPGEEAVLFAVPKHLGLFDEANLDVRFEFTAGSGVAIQLVEGGQADMGQGNPSSVYAAIEQGADIKMVYNIIPRYGSGLAVLPDGPVQSTDDLAGATIGVASLQSARVLDAKAMVTEAGLDPEADVDYVAVGTGAQAAAALTSGHVDGLYLWDAAYETITLSGTELRVIRDVFPDVDRLLDFVQYASTSALEEKRGAIEAWGRAVAIAQEWAADHPEDALEMYYREYPNARPNDDEGRQRDLAILNFTLDQFTPEDGRWGHLPAEAVDFTGNFLEGGGIISEALTYEDYVVDITDAFNDYTADDVAAVSP